MPVLEEPLPGGLSFPQPILPGVSRLEPPALMHATQVARPFDHAAHSDEHARSQPQE